jgi:hypothetical protein
MKRTLLAAAVLALAAGATAAHADQFTFEYPDDGSDWYYLNATTATCDPMPDSIATPLKYAGWIHANGGQVNDFQVAPNNPAGHWVEFTTVSPSGFTHQVSMIQPYGDCQAVLSFQVANHVLPNAPGSAP